MRATFADARTGMVFRRIFGAEGREQLLVELLEALLELEGKRRIVEVEHLPLGQRMAVPGMKRRSVQLRCTDVEGHRYVVEMQVLVIEGFDKGAVHDASKGYGMQLQQAGGAPTHEVVGVTICDFMLWPQRRADGRFEVPMLSRWRMQERHSGVLGLSQVQYVFLELPKYEAGAAPSTTVEKWAYFFREARNLDVVPPPLAERPFVDALDVARTARFTPEEWEAYERAKMAEQDARGALALAHREGVEEGELRGQRQAIEDLCDVLGIEVTSDRRGALAAAGAEELKTLRERIKRERRWD